MRYSPIHSVSVSILLLATSARAAIPVPVGNAPLQNFTILPALTDWSTQAAVTPATGPFAGAGGGITGDTSFDTQVALLAASDMGTVLLSGAASGTSQSAKWRSDLQHAATQPTGVSFNGIMATMSNAAAVPLTSINLSWTGGVDLAASTNVNATDDNGYLNGHRLYYSTSATGAAGSFLPVGNYLFPASTTATPSQTWAATINFPTSVAPSAQFYLLWVDDNALTNNDGAYFIDDVQVTGVPEPTSVATLLAGLGILASRRRRTA